MEYFSAEYIATALVENSDNQLISELNYELNQEILQFIGGLSTAFVDLNRRLIFQLEFTTPSGSNVYRKNLATSLLYSNRESGIELINVSISDCNFRRKKLLRSSFAGVHIENCAFTEVQISDLDVGGVTFGECKFVSCDLKNIFGEFSFSNVVCEQNNFIRLQGNNWRKVRFKSGKISGCTISFEDGVVVAKTTLTSTSISLRNARSLQNTIRDTNISHSKFVQAEGTVSFGNEITLLKNPQLDLVGCTLDNVTFSYPVLSFDLYSLENLTNSSGILFTSVLNLTREARNSSALRPTSANVSPTLSAFFRLYSEKQNQILIVNLDSDESVHVLRRLIEFAGALDPLVVIRALSNNKEWLPPK